MATIITDDGDLNHELIQLADAKQWKGNNKAQTLKENSRTKQELNVPLWLNLVISPSEHKIY